MRRSHFPIWFVLCVVFCACKDNVICPAFQSTYILNDSIRMAKYSLFLNDSTPKYASASRKNKYGIEREMSMFRKNYELKTAPKVNVLGEPEVDPFFDHTDQEGEFLASDFVDTDSIGVDSVIVAPAFAVKEDKGPHYKYRYHPNNAYNEDQQYYNKYYGELLVDNRPPPPTPEDLARQREEQQQTIQSSDSTMTAPDKKRSKRKKKSETAQEENDAAEVDSETLQQAQDALDQLPAEESEIQQSDDQEGN